MLSVWFREAAKSTRKFLSMRQHLHTDYSDDRPCTHLSGSVTYLNKSPPLDSTIDSRMGHFDCQGKIHVVLIVALEVNLRCPSLKIQIRSRDQSAQECYILTLGKCCCMDAGPALVGVCLVLSHQY